MHRNTLPDKVLWLEPDRTPFAHSPPIVNTSMQHAHWLLRLLWEADAARDGLRELDWDLLLHVARPNGVLVRTAERLATQGVTVPDRFAAAVAQERQRIRSALELMRQVSLACEAHGITFLFPKAFQDRSEEHTSELQSLAYLVCRLLLEKKNSRSIDRLHA